MNDPFGTVWVIGLGAAGARWAGLLAGTGRRVFGLEPDDAALGRARDRVRRLTGRTFEELGVTAGVLDRLDAAPPDLVIEAVPEHLELKAQVLRRADAGCGPDAVFATTTMGLPVTELAALGGRMTRTVGLQLCDRAGAGTGGVVEIIRTPVTDEGVLDAVRALAGELGAAATTEHDHPGSAGGALVLRYLNRAAAMYERGYAARDDIDTAMTLGCGLPIGPLALLDRIGIDTVHASLEALARRTGDPVWAPARILTLMREAGLHGRKTGRGFYDHRSADRAPAAAAGPPARRPGREIRRVGVMGAGTMATGIAEVFAGAGHATTLVARSDVRAKQARDVIEGSLARRVRKGRLTAGAMAATLDRLTCGADPDELAGCDLVIEAVAEEIAVKRDVFARLDRLARPGAILATTTSSLPVIQCATATTRPQDVLGLHFFNPAPAMRLVEVVHTFLTGEEVVDTATALVTGLGKHPVRCGDRSGFIVNALLLPYLNDAVAMARSRGLRLADVDQVMTEGHGYPMGPFRLLDMIGLDVSLAILENIRGGVPELDIEIAPDLAELVASGCLGRKSGRGFYPYPAG